MLTVMITLNVDGKITPDIDGKITPDIDGNDYIEC